MLNVELSFLNCVNCFRFLFVSFMATKIRKQNRPFLKMVNNNFGVESFWNFYLLNLVEHS